MAAWMVRFSDCERL